MHRSLIRYVALALAAALVTAACTNASSESTTTTTGATTTTTTGGTTTTLPPAQFDIVFQLDDAVTVGALGFDVDYTAAPGDFVGSGGDAGAGGTLECSSLAAGALATFNDDDAGTLSAGYIALGGITGPADLATCVFQQSGPTAPVAGDFTITVTDASDTSLAPISPLPTVSVKSITPK